MEFVDVIRRVCFGATAILAGLTVVSILEVAGVFNR